MIPYGKQFIDDDDINGVIEVLQSPFLTQGPAVKEFEESFARYVGAKYAVAVTNGTAALHLSNLALGIGPEDFVITTPLTFVASANGSRYVGATVEFVDIDKDTLCIDLDKLESKLASKPVGHYKAVIPVDFAGYPVDMIRLKKLSVKYGFKIIEDACHAPGAYYDDSKGDIYISGNGKHSDLTVFSFHPVKHIATGEGGIITTNSSELYKKLCLLRTHGITMDSSLLNENHGGWYYEMQELGFNYRLCDILASLGTTQLKKADKGLERRRELANRYNEMFKGEKIKLPRSNYNSGHAFHLYVIMVDDRKGLYDHLRERSIFAQIHYIPVHMQPYYKALGWDRGDFPVVEEYYDQCISLPMYPTLTDEEQKSVVDAVLEFVGV